MPGGQTASQDHDRAAPVIGVRTGSRWPAILVLAGLSLYLVVFFTTRLPGVTWLSPAGDPATRLDVLVAYFNPRLLFQLWCGGDTSQIALLDRGRVLAVAALILAVAQLIGWLVLKALRADRSMTRLEVFVFAEATGLQILSLVSLAVGLMGRLHPPWTLAGGLVVIAGLAAWRWWGDRAQGDIVSQGGPDRKSRTLTGERSGEGQDGPASRPSPNPSLQGRGTDLQGSGTDLQRRGTFPAKLGEDSAGEAPDQRWLDGVCLALAIPFVVVILWGAMLPPWDFDVREYHLQVPKEFFQQGFIGFLPHNVYGNMPLGAEMLALLAMVWTPGDDAWWYGALAGKTVMAACAPLTALALLAAGRRFVSAPAGAVAALLYISTPWVVRISVSGLNEGVLALQLLLSVYAVLLWQTSSPPQDSRQQHVEGPSQTVWMLLARTDGGCRGDHQVHRCAVRPRAAGGVRRLAATTRQLADAGDLCAGRGVQLRSLAGQELVLHRQPHVSVAVRIV